MSEDPWLCFTPLCFQIPVKPQSWRSTSPVLLTLRGKATPKLSGDITRCQLHTRLHSDSYVAMVMWVFDRVLYFPSPFSRLPLAIFSSLFKSYRLCLHPHQVTLMPPKLLRAIKESEENFHTNVTTHLGITCSYTSWVPTYFYKSIPSTWIQRQSVHLRVDLIPPCVFTGTTP